MDTAAEARIDTLPPVAAPLRVAITSDDGTLTVTVHGEADIYTSGQLLEELMSVLPTCSPSVVLNFSDLSFCDLRGIDAVRHFVGAATADGARVDMCGMSPLMRWMYDTFAPSGTGPDPAGRGR